MAGIVTRAGAVSCCSRQLQRLLLRTSHAAASQLKWLHRQARACASPSRRSALPREGQIPREHAALNGAVHERERPPERLPALGTTASASPRDERDNPPPTVPAWLASATRWHLSALTRQFHDQMQPPVATAGTRM
jgi:hypothetical protein